MNFSKIFNFNIILALFLPFFLYVTPTLSKFNVNDVSKENNISVIKQIQEADKWEKIGKPFFNAPNVPNVSDLPILAQYGSRISFWLKSSYYDPNKNMEWYMVSGFKRVAVKKGAKILVRKQTAAKHQGFYQIVTSEASKIFVGIPIGGTVSIGKKEEGELISCPRLKVSEFADLMNRKVKGCIKLPRYYMGEGKIK